MCHRIIECELLTGTWSAEGIMASGHVNRVNRPNTWPQPTSCSVNKTLANGEPSTHGTSATLQAGPDMSALGQFANIPRQGRQVEKVLFSFKQPVGDAIFSGNRTVTARDTIFRKPAL